MPRQFAYLLPLAFFLVLPQNEAVAAASFESEYAVSVRSLPIGRAALTATVDGERYDVGFSGEVRGLMRIFSDGAATVSASGETREGRLHPAHYTHLWTEDDEEERVAMRFDGARVTDLSAEPPRRKPERYVPVTEAHKTDVMDPISALVWPLASDFGPEICDRTLPLFDGRNRFDLALAFSREEQFETRDGSYGGTAMVCSIRYRPVAGHRPDRDSVRFMEANKDMEVWMAPAGATGLVAPVRIQVRTKAGRVVLEARRFDGR